MIKIESKEKLAKLLAVEDLDIQHQQVKTAMFDVKNRCLILPIWKDMPDHLYDLLVGHEVGHALFTPSNIDRIHKIVAKTSKDCVNCIEDARIEKLVKRRYPGLRKPFYKGYNNLIERNFFGLEDREINQSGFLDRINIFFKMPQYGDIIFNDVEQIMVERIQDAKSFKDVEEISLDVHAYIKENEQQKDNPKLDSLNNEEQANTPDFSDEDSMPDSQKESDEKGEDTDKDSEDDSATGDETETDEGKDKGKDDSDEGSETDKDGDSGDGGDINDYDDGEKPEHDKPPEEEVKSYTQRHFDENMLKSHIDTSKDNTYLNIPDNINFNEAIIDFKTVHNNINKFYNVYNSNVSTNEDQFNKFKSSIHDNAKKTLQKLKKDSLKNVNHIAMEFERKKCADIYKRILVTKSGVLDTNKMFSAKYNEDVFKKNIRVPEGKNHGLVMFVDWSGSMSLSISDCIKQVIELTFFCKKVNIPFDVYSFTDAMYDTRTERSFNYKHNDFAADSKVKLRNYLSSKMTTKEYNNALQNMCIFINRFSGGYQSCASPREDDLCSTPLNGAIILSEHVIRAFKRKNNLESVHAVWLTDGDANNSSKRWDAEKRTTVSYFEDKYPNIWLKDKKTKKNYCIYGNGSRSTTSSLFDIVKSRLGINVIGFFIVPSFSLNNLWRFVPKNHDPKQTYHEREFQKKEWVKQVKKDNYFVKEEAGYDEYYVINSQLNDRKPIQTINEGMTASKMANIFSKRNNQFKAKRVILSKFVDLITAK